MLILPVETITSRRNALVSFFREAARPRASDDRRVLIEGARLLAEARAADIPIRVAAFLASVADDPHPDTRRLIDELHAGGTRLVRVTASVLEAMSPARTSSGVVAIGDRMTIELTSLLTSGPPALVLLERVQDPGNVGAVVRVAESAGATGVITGPGSADPFGWKSLRGAMGSAFRLPVVQTTDTGPTLAALTQHGVRLIATVPRDGLPLFEVDLRGPVAILLGSEGSGLTPSLLAHAHHRLSIPMQRPVESLNVAVTAALVLYERLRQRLSS